MVGSPSTATLLKHSFFKKAHDATHLARALLSKVEDIGEGPMTAGIADALPGSGPLYAKGTKAPAGAKKDEKAYVPGTTWVFDDDEDGGPAGGPKQTDNMSMDDFASQFDMVTGGEEFRTEG